VKDWLRPNCQLFLIAARKICQRKPAARRSDCVGKLGLPLQTGRGAAFKLVLLSEFDQQSIKPRQLPWPLSLLAKSSDKGRDEPSPFVTRPLLAPDLAAKRPLSPERPEPIYTPYRPHKLPHFT
jgi:hypothetical protein